MINRLGENIKNAIEYEISRKLVLKFTLGGRLVGSRGAFCIFGGNYSGEMRYFIYKKSDNLIHTSINEQTFEKITSKLPLINYSRLNEKYK